MSNSTSDAPERWSWERDRMEKHPNGFWVQASDYDSLQSQLTAARAENVNHVDQLNRLIQERNELANKLALAPDQRVHQQSETGELLPCPFCGSAGELVEWAHAFAVICTNVECRADIGNDYGLQKARVIRLWNTRAHAPVDDERIRQIREWRAKQYGHSFTGTIGTDRAMADIDYLLALVDKKEDSK